MPYINVPGSIHFVELLCSFSSSVANYCKWQLLKGVLMYPFYMDTSNIVCSDESSPWINFEENESDKEKGNLK